MKYLNARVRCGEYTGLIEKARTSVDHDYKISWDISGRYVTDINYTEEDLGVLIDTAEVVIVGDSNPLPEDLFTL